METKLCCQHAETVHMANSTFSVIILDSSDHFVLFRHNSYRSVPKLAVSLIAYDSTSSSSQLLDLSLVDLYTHYGCHLTGVP